LPLKPQFGFGRPGDEVDDEIELGSLHNRQIGACA
jgi:hypothetical protein